MQSASKFGDLMARRKQRNTMKNKTWQKMGELILDYSKIILAIGVVSPFVNDLSLENSTKGAIIIGTTVLMITGLAIYNKGADDEHR